MPPLAASVTPTGATTAPSGMMPPADRTSFLLGNYSPKLGQMTARSSREGSSGSAHVSSPEGSGGEQKRNEQNGMRRVRHQSVRPRAERLKIMGALER